MWLGWPAKSPTEIPRKASWPVVAELTGNPAPLNNRLLSERLQWEMPMQPDMAGGYERLPEEGPPPGQPLDRPGMCEPQQARGMPEEIAGQVQGPVTLEERDLDRLWQYFAHDDNQLSQRVAFFLVAESIFLATAASLVSVVAGMTSPARLELRAEVFAFSLIIILAGFSLSVIFWYLFRLNFADVGASLELLKTSESIYSLVGRRQSERRREHKHLPALFRGRGKNWVTVNCLGVGFIAVWACTGIFAVLVFSSRPA